MFNLILAAISAFIMMFILSGEGMDREHLELLNTESTVNFDQFVRDYLNVGEVNFLNISRKCSNINPSFKFFNRSR